MNFCSNFLLLIHLNLFAHLNFNLKSFVCEIHIFSLSLPMENVTIKVSRSHRNVVVRLNLSDFLAPAPNNKNLISQL